MNKKKHMNNSNNHRRRLRPITTYEFCAQAPAVGNNKNIMCYTAAYCINTTNSN